MNQMKNVLDQFPKNRQIRNAYLGLSLAIGVVSCADDSVEKPLFELLDSSETNINFINKLVPTDTMNIVNFEYMFNGAGVGIGDINNDGLKDIYLTGNQVADKLYLNKGDLTFQDITQSAGIQSSGWSNGVSITDINSDGLLDIYVCHGGIREWPRKDWANKLYVNNGDGTFNEMAHEYGIADTGYSIQGVFFDYDKDGDRDLYILTNALVDYNRNTSRYKSNDGSADSTDRLYRNNGDGSFTNISLEAGITMEGFGLGVSVCDINGDGWLDLYISNDFLTDDILFVNNQDGSFSNQINTYFKHLSYNGMGNDMADINNDGHVELFTVDMFPSSNERIKQTMMKPSFDVFSKNIEIGYSPQFVRNTLQFNNGNQTYSEIGQFSGIYNTDWSWAPLIADYDNDGLNDVFITNGYRRDITNLDYLDYTQRPASYSSEAELVKSELERVEKLPEVKLPNYIYKNNGDLTFTEKIKEWGVEQPLYSNGAAYADLDNDGDLDLVVNNIDDTASIYKNTSSDYLNTADGNAYLTVELEDKNNGDLTGTQLWAYLKGNVQYHFSSNVRGYLSTVDSKVHFGLGSSEKLDSLLVIWNNGKGQTLYNIDKNQNLTVQKGDAVEVQNYNKSVENPLFKETSKELGIDYSHQEDDFDEFKVQTTLLKMNTKLGPGIAVGDVNGDGLEDFYVGGTKAKKGVLFVQKKEGGFDQQSIACASNREDMGVVFVDLDMDGDLDLLSIDGGGIEEMAMQNYRDMIYYNDGAGNFSCEALLQRKARGSATALADYDRDGDLDIFVAGRVINGFYPKSPKSYLLRNEKGTFKDVTSEILSEQEMGMISDALWTDFDNDGWFDLVLVGEFMEIKFLKNVEGTFQDITSSTGLKYTQGWWNSIAPGDFDGDGDMDYVLGNFGLNSDFKCSPQQPLTIYIKDFDGNGRVDPLISCYREGQEHLIHTRDILIGQISAMKGKFKDYESYAQADFDEVSKVIGLETAETLKAYTFASSYIENLGNGRFSRKELPNEVQFSPVFGILTNDFNNDGNLDMFVTGNQYDIEPFIGQSDASIGYCLLGDGTGNFQVLNPARSGLSISGSAKGMAMLNLPNDEHLALVAINSGELKAYQTEIKGTKTVQLNPEDAFAIIRTKDGKKQRIEFAYGNVYLGNSSHTLSYHRERVLEINVTNYKGETRALDLP